MPYDQIHITFNALAHLPPLQHELRSPEGIGYRRLYLGVNDDTAPRLLEGTGVRILPLSLLLTALTRSQHPAWKILRFLEFLVRAWGRLLVTPTRVIVAHDLPAVIPAWFAARLTGRRIIYHAHEIWGEANGVTAPAEGLWRRLDRFFCPRVDAMVVPEIHRAAHYRDRYGARALPLLVPNCPPYREPHPTPVLRNQLPESAREGILVLYQGLLDPGRGLHALVSAFALLPPSFVLVLMGRGSKEVIASLHRHAEDHRIRNRVWILDPVPWHELPAWTSGADIGVLLYRDDCTNNRFCAPNKLYEYWQAGLPVLGARLPSITPLIEKADLGAVADPEDPQDLAHALLSLSSPQRRLEIRTRALNAARDNYRWDLTSSPLWTLYRSFSSNP